MGNRVDIYLTKFVDIDLKGNETGSTFGLRVCDNEETVYMNGLTADEIVGKSPAEIVDLARDIDDRSRDMLAFAQDTQDGLNINDDFFTWSDIRPASPAI